MTDNYLILISGEDKTSSVTAWRYEERKPVVFVTYTNGKAYPYNVRDVLICKDPTVVSMEVCCAFKDGEPIHDANTVQIFGEGYCRILYQSGYKELLESHRIKLIRSSLEDPKAKQCFSYLKELAEQVGPETEGHNTLAEHYQSIDYVREDSVLSAFLTGKIPNAETESCGDIIYPFGMNDSQKKAVVNAFAHRVSVIEGSPGTGKTQTVLNIIANAVMRGKSVAVVSGNNAATNNVLLKLNQYGLGFIVAPLGSVGNKTVFIEGQSRDLPDMRSWQERLPKLPQLCREETEIAEKASMQKELSALREEKSTLENEFLHFGDFYRTVRKHEQMPVFGGKTTSTQIMTFMAEYEQLQNMGAKFDLFAKLRFRFRYGLHNLKCITLPVEEITPHCQNLYYIKRLEEIEKRIAFINKALKDFDPEQRMNHYRDGAMAIFRGELAKRYGNNQSRRIYTQEDLRKEPNAFIRDYPVVLSTTYSLRSSLSREFVYDYIIVDEASQVDIATGALALSCAKRAVIVGDKKQLPNAVTAEQKRVTDGIFAKYRLPKAYSHAENSLLSSFLTLFDNIPHVLLREHYRCHPHIIGFCNQRFYDNQLIVLTNPKADTKPLTVYRTAAGYHARGHVNQRQIDVIQKEIVPNEHLNLYDGSVGIVTPYRNQAQLLQRAFAGTTVKADTADKFQGQERSVMIFCTVDNEIGDFAADPNRLNVAVSRAVDRLIVVTDGNDNDKASPVHDLIGYVQYHNHEIINSKIHSVFDYLYKNYGNAREEVLKKYGAVSDMDSENLMYSVIREVLEETSNTRYGVVPRFPLRMMIRDYLKLTPRELAFTTNHLTHVDFLIYSKLTHQPVLAVEVDGFAYHHNEKQIERDRAKDAILRKYDIPMLRLSTVGCDEKGKLSLALQMAKTPSR